jgi:hypothetical protein
MIFAFASNFMHDVVVFVHKSWGLSLFRIIIFFLSKTKIEDSS